MLLFRCLFWSIRQSVAILFRLRRRYCNHNIARNRNSILTSYCKPLYSESAGALPTLLCAPPHHYMYSSPFCLQQVVSVNYCFPMRIIPAQHAVTQPSQARRRITVAISDFRDDDAHPRHSGDER